MMTKNDITVTANNFEKREWKSYACATSNIPLTLQDNAELRR